MGFRVISTDYEFPAVIQSEQDPYVKDLNAFLNVRLFGEKIADTPDEYIFESRLDDTCETRSIKVAMNRPRQTRGLCCRTYRWLFCLKIHS
jgi:hypothetical protein